MKQFLLEQKCRIGESFNLSEEDFHYLCHVRRHKINQVITVKDTDGGIYSAELSRIDEKSCTLTILEEIEQKERYFSIELYCCFPKGKKLDGIVRQATETGVEKIIPLFSDHSMIQYKNMDDFSHKKNRLNKIIKEAQQQSGSGLQTQLSDPLTIDDLETAADGECCFFCHQEFLSKNTLSILLQKEIEKVKILIGPEGGLSDREIQILDQKGFHPLFLGDNVLRAETACLFAVSSVITVMELL